MKKTLSIIRGYYSFSSSEYDNEFIEDFWNEKNPKFIFSSVDDSLILETKFYADKINFYSSDNNFRAIGRFSNDTISGRYKNQHGEYFDFIMTLDSSYNQKILVKTQIILMLVFQKYGFQINLLALKKNLLKKIFCLKMQLYGQMKKRVY